MTIDIAYYTRRMEEERARASEGGEASAIHAELAMLYADLLGQGEGPRLHDETVTEPPLT